MAHEVETMAYANAVPWHGLGANVSPDLSPKEFLEAAGLNWRVEKCPLKAEMNGEMFPVKDRFALVRDKDKKVMTVCGRAWKPVQNEDIINFMKKYVEAGGAKMETAGSLRDGRTVWALANLGHDFEVGRGDKVKGYLLMTTSHVVGVATTSRVTNVRVVCANTLAYAERGVPANYRQNHLTEFNVSAAQEAVENAHEELAACEKRYKTLNKLKIGIEDAVRKVLIPVFTPEIIPGEKADAEAKEVWDNVMNPDVTPTRIQALIDSINNAPGALPGTGWGVLNGVTHWCDHVQGHNNATRMHRSWMGDYGRNKVKVEEELIKLTA